MLLSRILGYLAMSILLVSSVSAGSKEDLQKYFNDASRKVKETTDPSQKREILHKSFETMSVALDAVGKLPLVTDDERAGIDRYKTTLKEKQDELAGLNGYERVPDAQLNAFSDYVVQDMEQADQYITISLVAALLILILLVLII